ncbi:MAG: dipeptide epimerase [Acidobacteria bacterium]|jgi:L-alanine-DL-glutamate epimerase-like enolase superfamily enzyme|nr:dipeptide epimerase [Acidobacteriota bacterium]
MRRREWLKATGTLAGGTVLPATLAGGESRAGLVVETLHLELRHTWTTTMSSSETRDTVLVRYRRDGVEGLGEGAPIVRYGEDAARARAALEDLADLVEEADPWLLEKVLGKAFARLEHQYAARAALDIALHDWRGRKLGMPLHRLLGLDPADAPLTTFSIGIDSPEMTRQKVREAAEFPVLKIKVGLDSDEDTIAAVREVTDKPLRVDVNEGWKDRETAVRKIEWLAARGVELVEQPMPAAMLEETGWVRERVDVPLFADEACGRAHDIPRLSGVYDGVNIKLDKSGGIREGLRMIHTARACDLGVMLGCMISSSVSTTAAAHLSPLVDYADLDGHLLIANDPWSGVEVREGRLTLPDRPGLGLISRDRPR